MSKIDFQNGFALGLVSGGTVSNSGNSEIKDYAKKNLRYNEVYYYNVSHLRDIVLDEEQNIKCYDVFPHRATSSFENELAYILTITFRLYTHKGEQKLVQSPFEITQEDEAPFDFSNIVNIGLGLGDGISTLEDLKEELVDGESIINASTLYYWSKGLNYYSCMIGTITFYVREEDVLDVFEEEVLPVLSGINDIYFIYENNPYPVIESEIYIGDDA
jgi:hypothetical protein